MPKLKRRLLIAAFIVIGALAAFFFSTNVIEWVVATKSLSNTESLRSILIGALIGAIVTLLARPIWILNQSLLAIYLMTCGLLMCQGAMYCLAHPSVLADRVNLTPFLVGALFTWAICMVADRNWATPAEIEARYSSQKEEKVRPRFRYWRGD
jgi:hypothetical protein